MSKNDINTLRGFIFDTLRALADPANPMDIERARAIADVAQTAINSAKVEVDYIRATGSSGGSQFIPLGASGAGADDGAVKVLETRPGLRVTQHRLQG